MCPVLAIYGADDILAYVRGTLVDKEEEREIERLVESDLRAADVVENIKTDQIGDDQTFDIEAFRRLRRLQKIANKKDCCI